MYNFIKDNAIRFIFIIVSSLIMGVILILSLVIQSIFIFSETFIYSVSTDTTIWATLIIILVYFIVSQSLIGQRFSSIAIIPIKFTQYLKDNIKHFYKYCFGLVLVLLYVITVSGVTVGERGIVVHSVFNPMGKLYFWSEMYKVNIYFKSGDFYYDVITKDNKTFNLHQTPEEKDPDTKEVDVKQINDIIIRNNIPRYIDKSGIKEYQNKANFEYVSQSYQKDLMSILE